ncbi:MAG TPA: hypothetical protein VHN98_00475, partial [Acidimicrobiales bacterium]|nr:hypothetical protein [Acidimicrobiales bacterium]
MAESRWFPVVAFVVAAGAVFVVTVASVHLLSSDTVPVQGYPQHRFFEGWTRWDTGWYFSIATQGYRYFGPGVQASVAFFPAYPLAMRFADVVVPGDALAAGVVVTYALGLLSVVLFWRWCRAAIRSDAVPLAVAVLVLWPCAFFLYGAVYSDALFLAAALGSLLLLE